MPKILGLERHYYAPELNRLHWDNGCSLSVPNCYTIHQAKENYLKPVCFNKFVTIRYINKERPNLNRTYAGTFENYKSLKRVIKSLKQRHNLGGEFKLSFKIIGGRVDDA